MVFINSHENYFICFFVTTQKKKGHIPPLNFLNTTHTHVFTLNLTNNRFNFRIQKCWRYLATKELTKIEILSIKIRVAYQ